MNKKFDRFFGVRNDTWTFLIFYCLALYASILPATDWLKSIPGDLGDARFNSYILEHVYQWSTGKVGDLWSPQFFYPFHGGLAFSDNHFGSIFTYILSRSFGLDRENAYLAWFIVGSSLNYLSMYYVLRKLGFSSLASAFGAIIFSVSLPTAFKSAHAQLVYRFAIPLAFLCFWNFFRYGKSQYFYWMLCFLAWQFFCSVYLGVFSFYLLLSLFLGWLLLGQNKKIWFKEICANNGKKRSVIKYIPIALAIALCLGVMLMLWKYLEVSRFYEFTRNISEIDSMLPRLESYAYAPLSYLYGAFVDVNTLPFPNHLHHEHMMFIGVFSGIMLLLGAAYAVMNKENVLGRISLFSLSLLFLSTLYVGGSSLYHYILNIPGISAVRAVSRIVLVMLIPVSILIAIAVDNIKEKLVVVFNKIGVRIFAVMLFILGGAEIALYKHYNTSISEWRTRHDATEALLKQNTMMNSVIYLMPGKVKDRFLSEIDGMIVAQNNGLKTINGYSGNTPLKGWGDDQWLYACLGIEPRIKSYIKYTKLKEDSLNIEDLMKDIAIIVPPECVGKNGKALDNISYEFASNLKLSVNIIPNNAAVINIKNNSNFVLLPKLHSGPIRLSWRVVPDDGKNHNDIGWDTRLDLISPVNPGSDSSYEINPLWPKLPGVYRLEVSMVYEGVSWFHNLGLKVGNRKFTVK